MQTEYYIIIDGERQGPYAKDALKIVGVNEDTYVWRSGLPDWVRARELPELADVLMQDNSAFGTYAEMPSDPYFAMIGNDRVGPAAPDELVRRGLKPETPVWRNGMADWQPASTQPELVEAIRRSNSSVGHQSQTPPGFNFGRSNPYYGAQTDSQPYNQYDKCNGYRPVPTNWLPWAIVATICGFLFSCVGGIFGIIGIVQANSANNYYRIGQNDAGDQANSTARTMTIIGLVLSGLGLLFAISMGQQLVSLASLSYL